MTPANVPQPELIKWNSDLARDLGAHDQSYSDRQLVEVFSGQLLPPGSEPIAMAYAGHQFGSFVPRLADGRALLLGDVLDPSGRRRDIQRKGSGRTPFSRSGDGKAPLGPVLREYIVSEALHHLGLPTTSNQAKITLWNLSRLGSCLLLLADRESKEEPKAWNQEVENFRTLFEQRHTTKMLERKKSWLTGIPECSYLSPSEKICLQ